MASAPMWTPILTLGVAGGERSIAGRVTILRGDYRRRLRLLDLLGTGGAAAAPPAPAGPGALDDVRLDISVATADDIIVDNNYGRLELASQLTVAGTLAKPVLAGRLSFGEGGRVFLGGRTYSVRRGTIAFTNPAEIEPVLDLALETRVQQDDITLEITGTPDTLDVSLRSPGLSQQDAISLLLTGQPADDSTVAYSDIAQGQLLVLLSGEILGAAGQRRRTRFGSRQSGPWRRGVHVRSARHGIKSRRPADDLEAPQPRGRAHRVAEPA